MKIKMKSLIAFVLMTLAITTSLSLLSLAMAEPRGRDRNGEAGEARGLIREIERVRNVTREAQERIVRACNASFERLEAVKEGVIKSKLSEGEKKKLIEVIETRVARLAKLCAKTEGMIEPAAFRALIKEIRTELKEAQNQFASARHEIQLRRIGLIVERAEKLETRLNESLERWIVAGCNETKFNQLVSEFDARITEARAAYDESKALRERFIESIKAKKPETEILRQAQEKMQLAQSKLKEVHFVLKELLSELRSCKQLE